MIFGGERHSKDPHITTIVRDVVEIVAIIAAGIWAFYVFAYENRIKPSMADPDVNITASMKRLGEHNGLIGVGLHLELHNVGTVRAHFLGVAVNVYGQRIVAATPAPSVSPGSKYEFHAFYRAEPPIPVYADAYITNLGDPKSGHDAALDPGSAITNDQTFYVPEGRFDLLTLGIDAPYTKFEDTTIPSRLVVTPQGDAKVVTSVPPSSSTIEQYKIPSLTALDLR